MSKFIVFVFAVICFVSVHSRPDGYQYASTSDGNSWMNRGQYNGNNWPQMPQIQMPRMPQIQMPQMPRIQPPRIPTAEEIANMKAQPGGHYQGMVSFSNSNTEYVDGKPVTKTRHVTLTNNDGVTDKQVYEN